jgi:hypothetical protein
MRKLLRHSIRDVTPGPVPGEPARWLADNKWPKGRWGEFELVARESGRSKVLKRVRG